ncbi:zinc-dependent alcohol dehydrogenase [Microbacterium sp. Root61]|uniref:zinc-dependent alcohol dehydrogenase n=1 Tax=Microbacterium sp. Root61 TaxID=1736570 RepID=UPI001F40CC49|nr:alcohol dehydrogenase catalytic domain-containing protein [Microbacterium sp. Root61]
MTYAGICGSDTHAVAGHHPLLPPPYLPGHELLGVVEKTGPGVDPDLVGTRAVVKPNVECGTCVNCLAGRTNACQSLAWIGCDPSGALPGGMAPLVVAPARNIFPLPDQVSDADGVLVECLATPVHAARIAGDLGGARVMVIGAGTIGLFSVIAARRAGAGVIVVSDPEPSKRERALQFGADHAVDAFDPDFAEKTSAGLGGTADVVFDCVGIETSIRQAMSVLRRAGTLLIVGVPPRDGSVPLPLIQDWELRVQGCANYTAEDIETAIAIAAEGGLPGDQIVTGVYALEDASEAFAAAALGTAGKVVINPRA